MLRTNGVQLERRMRQLQFTCRKPRVVQHIAHQLQQGFGGIVDVFEFLDMCRFERFLEQHTTEAKDRVHGRTDFVADVREELVLGSLCRERLLPEPVRQSLCNLQFGAQGDHVIRGVLLAVVVFHESIPSRRPYGRHPNSIASGLFRFDSPNRWPVPQGCSQRSRRIPSQPRSHSSRLP